MKKTRGYTPLWPFSNKKILLHIHGGVLAKKLLGETRHEFLRHSIDRALEGYSEPVQLLCNKTLVSLVSSRISWGVHLSFLRHHLLRRVWAVVCAISSTHKSYHRYSTKYVSILRWSAFFLSGFPARVGALTWSGVGVKFVVRVRVRFGLGRRPLAVCNKDTQEQKTARKPRYCEICVFTYLVRLVGQRAVKAPRFGQVVNISSLVWFHMALDTKRDWDISSNTSRTTSVNIIALIPRALSMIPK